MLEPDGLHLVNIYQAALELFAEHAHSCVGLFDLVNLKHVFCAVGV